MGQSTSTTSDKETGEEHIKLIKERKEDVQDVVAERQTYKSCGSDVASNEKSAAAAEGKKKKEDDVGGQMNSNNNATSELRRKDTENIIPKFASEYEVGEGSEDNNSLLHIVQTKGVGAIQFAKSKKSGKLLPKRILKGK